MLVSPPSLSASRPCPHRTISIALAAALIALGAACADSSPSPTLEPTDVGPDALLDADDHGGRDTAADAPPDTDADLSPDAADDVLPEDATPDVALDAAPDAALDVAEDTRPDTSPDVPDHCPDLALTPPSPVGLPSVSGRHEAVTAGRFHDEYLYNADGFLKIGVRREWGGTIIFFGLDDGQQGMNNTNTIDANDTGREVQVAFYDPDRSGQGCAWNASCQTGGQVCPVGIRYLGWNPVQGGNRCNIGSGVEAVRVQDGVMEVQTLPREWNPDWDAQSCQPDSCGSAPANSRPSDVRVWQRLRFVRPHVVEVEYQLQNLAELDHAATLQELPTMYTANGHGGPDLWRMFDSSRVEVPIDTAAGGIDGFNYKNFTSPGPWVAFQNGTLDYGVGLYQENSVRDFQGWQQLALPFNNVRARFAFGIPARGTVRARAYLIIGALGTIEAEATWLAAHLPPFGTLDNAAVAPDGAVALGGWALDDEAVQRVIGRVDGVERGSLASAFPRPDVCLVWPGYPGCNAVGFGGNLPAGAVPDDGCPHALEVVAIDGRGNERVIDRRAVVHP